MEFIPLVILAAMVKKLIDWARLLIPDHIEPKVMIPISWVIGAAVALLFSLSPELASDIVIWGDHTLSSASLALVIVYGFAIGSVGGIIHDVVKPTTPVG